MNQARGLQQAMFDDDTFRLSELIPFIGAIITGAIGGCVASVQHMKTGRTTYAAFAAAYSITGAFGGLMALAGIAVLSPEWIRGWGELLLVTGFSGIATSLSLVAGNISMRFLLKKIGLEVTINVSRVTSRTNGREERDA